MEPEPEPHIPVKQNNEETLPEFLNRKFEEDEKTNQKTKTKIMKNRNEQSNPYKYICIFLLAVVVVGSFAFLGYERYYRGQVDQQLEDLRKSQDEIKQSLQPKTSLLNEVKNSVTVKQAKAETIPVSGTNKTAVVYAYNSEVGQTDGDPFTTASGSKVRPGIIANNCLKFGTKVEIAGKIYEVQDRMNSRYDCNTFDIWFADKAEALKWGKKTINVKIL